MVPIWPTDCLPKALHLAKHVHTVHKAGVVHLAQKTRSIAEDDKCGHMRFAALSPSFAVCTFVCSQLQTALHVGRYIACFSSARRSGNSHAANELLIAVSLAAASSPSGGAAWDVSGPACAWDATDGVWNLLGGR